MDFSVSGLIYRDPPVTKADLRRAKQLVAPVNFPVSADKAEISESVKALAIKMSDKATQNEAVDKTKQKQ